MAHDIGIDLGTTKVMVYDSEEGIVLREPSVVAVNNKTGQVLAVGEDAYIMVGKTPSHISAIWPLIDGVISDYDMTKEMIRHFVTKASGRKLIKPRVAICIPSGITDVESRAVIDTAVTAGARKVYLIEEPVAAAIGAGIDIMKPDGNAVIDIGGGTCDIAVISMGGIVQKDSIRLAGNKFDQAIIKATRNKYGVLIGEKTAEQVKKDVGSVFPLENKSTELKGRNLVTGLPQRLTVHTEDYYDDLMELAEQVVASMLSVFEKTPPELVGDIHTNGICMTGGGSLLDGLDRLMAQRTGVAVHIAEHPVDCVAIGTGKSFQYLEDLLDGITSPNTHSH